MALRLSRLRAHVPADAATSGAITVAPGQSRPLVSLKTEAQGSLTRILILGCTQHPDTTYSYETDGKGFSLPIPLGTLITPVYTCRDLGQYLEFQDTFTIAVQNNGTKPHRYAALVVVEPTVTRS